MTPKSLIPYSRLLLAKAQAAGLTSPGSHAPAPEAQELAAGIRRAADRIAGALRACPPGDIAELTDLYSFLHIIGFSRLPDPAFIARQRDRLFRLWQSGEKGIEESDVYAMMLSSIQSPTSILPPAQARALLEIRQQWLSDLDRHGSFPGVPAAERYSRLALLLRDNLGTAPDTNASPSSSPRAAKAASGRYTPITEALKRKLYRRNLFTDLHSGNRNLAETDTDTLISYRRFVRALFPAVLGYDSMADLDADLLRELSARPDLDPHDRQAYALALSNLILLQKRV